jgi:hypothetical protein
LTNVIFKWPDITLKLHHFSKLDLHAIKKHIRPGYNWINTKFTQWRWKHIWRFV